MNKLRWVIEKILKESILSRNDRLYLYEQVAISELRRKWVSESEIAHFLITLRKAPSRVTVERTSAYFQNTLGKYMPSLDTQFHRMKKREICRKEYSIRQRIFNFFKNL